MGRRWHPPVPALHRGYQLVRHQKWRLLCLGWLPCCVTYCSTVPGVKSTGIALGAIGGSGMVFRLGKLFFGGTGALGSGGGLRTETLSFPLTGAGGFGTPAGTGRSSDHVAYLSASFLSSFFHRCKCGRLPKTLSSSACLRFRCNGGLVTGAD